MRRRKTAGRPIFSAILLCSDVLIKSLARLSVINCRKNDERGLGSSGVSLMIETREGSGEGACIVRESDGGRMRAARWCEKWREWKGGEKERGSLRERGGRGNDSREKKRGNSCLQKRWVAFRHGRRGTRKKAVMGIAREGGNPRRNGLICSCAPRSFHLTFPFFLPPCISPSLSFSLQIYMFMPSLRLPYTPTYIYSPFLYSPSRFESTRSR